MEGATEFQLVNEKASYSLPPGSSMNPTEMTVDVLFDPVKLGVSRGRIVASALTAGEFVFILEGTCLHPQPKGPFSLHADNGELQPPLEFRNPFLRPYAFKIFSSNRAFQVRESTDSVKSKKTTSINVSFVAPLEGEASKDFSLLSQITVTPILESSASPDELVEWIYYVKCAM